MTTTNSQQPTTKTKLWKIKCNNTPEIIDRLIAPIRKRGISMQEFHFQTINQYQAEAELLFECLESQEIRIRSNMIKIVDVIQLIDIYEEETQINIR